MACPPFPHNFLALLPNVYFWNLALVSLYSALKLSQFPEALSLKLLATPD